MVVAIYNSKGGVGKTLSAVNLAASLSTSAPIERPVLLIDSDGQYSATSFFLHGENAPDLSLHDVLFGGGSLGDAGTLVRQGLCLVASDPRMVTADSALLLEPGSDLKLRRALRSEKKALGKGPVIIDVPSGWGGVARNAVLAATHVVIPINGEKMAFDTAIDTIERIASTCAAYDLSVPKTRILLTAYRDTVHGRDIAALCEDTWGKQVLKARIRWTEAVRALALDHKTVADRAAGSAREDYQALASEVSTWR